MNILYFATTSFYAKPNPSFHLMYAMISDLLANGDSIYYVGTKNKTLDKHIPDEFESHPNFHYRLISKYPAKRKNFIGRYLKGIEHVIKGRKYIKEFMPKCDVVFLQSSPTMAFNVMLAKKYATHQKLLMNVQDMFPGSSIASGIMPYTWMQNIFYWIQKIAYRKADVVVGISEDMRTKIIEQGVPSDKVAVILNWFDDKSIHYVDWDSNRFVKKHHMSKDKFYVQYAGTMGYVFDYKMVLAVAKLLEKYQDIEIQMIGIGSQKEIFVKAANEQKLNNIRFLPLEPQELVSDVYSACSVCYIPLKHGVIGNSVPSKAGLLMACKKAIITSVDEGCKYAEEINNNKIGVACADNDPNAVANAIIDLYKHPKKCTEMGERGYAYGHQLYSRSYNMKNT